MKVAHLNMLRSILMMYDFGHCIPFLEISFALNLGFSLWDELLKNVQKRIQESHNKLQKEIAGYDTALGNINMPNNESENAENSTNYDAIESKIARGAQKCGFYVCVIIALCILLIPHETSVALLVLCLVVSLAPSPALVTCGAKLSRPLLELRKNKKSIKDMKKIKICSKRIETRHTNQGKKVVEQGKSR